MSTQKEDLINVIRKLQTVISIVIFFIIFFFCWNVTEFKLVDIQLSHWGRKSVGVSWIWNSVIVLLSVSTFFNTFIYIKRNNRIKNKIIPHLLFGLVSIFLFFVGFFSVDYKIIHNIAAYLFFFTYPLSIFVMSYLNRKTLLYSEWFTHLLISIIMVVGPLIFISMFEGMAITEIVHVVTVCYWNLYIVFKNF
jgi:hypothetical membrane protein